MLVSRGRLSNDLAWTIPIVLDVDEETATKMKEAGNVLLKNPAWHWSCSDYTLMKHLLLIKKKQPKEFMVQMIHHIQVLHIQCQ